jgi:hypothetical protein
MIRNFLGRMKGCSGCGICGDTWNWKKEHVVEYAEGRGAFPVCEECWRKAPEEAIIKAAVELGDLWLRDSPTSAYQQNKVNLMLEAVNKEVRMRESGDAPLP